MSRMAEEEPDIRFHGIELEVRRFGGPKAVQVLHAVNQEIRLHKHDWACVTLPVISADRECFESGEALLEGPILHPPGSGKRT